MKGRCRWHGAHSTLSFTDSRRPQMEQVRGDMRSKSRVRKLLFIGDVRDVETLADDVGCEAPAHGKPHDLHPQFVVAGGACGLQLLLDERAQHVEIIRIVYRTEDVVNDAVVDALHPQGLLYLAAAPLGVVYLVADEGPCEPLVIDKASADQSLYAPVYGMNDGEAHCVIASVDGTNSNLWMMADGAWKQAKIESAQAERHSTKRMLIGGISESGDNSNKFFDGDIAAIRLYNKALTVAEMNAVTDYYAAKYAIRRAPTVGVDSASVSGYGLAATSITVAADATLRLPSGETSPFKIGAGRSISGGGAVQGTLGVAADGALAMGSEGLTVDALRLDSGARIILTEAFAHNPAAISAGALTASGTVNVEFGDGVDLSSFGTERLPLIRVASAPSLTGGTSSWTCEKGRVALVGNTVYYTPAIGLVISIR